MELIVSKAQFLILISTMIIFSTNTLAVLPEAKRAELTAQQHQEQKGATLASRTGSTPRLQPISLKNDFPTDVGYYINFAGAYIKTPPSGTYSNVSAKWIVPKVSLPSGASGDGVWSMYEWVGIGAVSCLFGWLSGGIYSSITVNGGKTSYQAQAFYGLGSNPSISILNLDVEVGDNIEAVVIAVSPTEGIAMVKNHDKGTSATATAYAPNPSTTLCATDVEWVVQGPDTDPTYLSSFEALNFEHCKAYTTTNQKLNLGHAGLVNMTDSSGRILVEAKRINHTHLYTRGKV